MGTKADRGKIQSERPLRAWLAATGSFGAGKGAVDPARGGSGWAGAGRERGGQTLLHHTELPSETLETVTQGVDHLQGQWPEHMMSGISQI